METKLKIEKQGKIVLYGPNGAGKSSLIRSALEGHLEAGRSAVLITESYVKQFGVEVFVPDMFSFADWGNVAVADPAVARRLYLEVCHNKYYDPDLGWIPLRQLSYGQRRRLAIEAALETGDFVAVENFEAGLHVDYIAELIKQIAESDAAVILETHSGLVLRLAARYGLSAYYVERDAVTPIERLDDVRLFQRELSAYHAVVPHK
jgi:energy-coupling factor transporter ATP-binding protein EcfA2